MRILLALLLLVASAASAVPAATWTPLVPVDAEEGSTWTFTAANQTHQLTGPELIELPVGLHSWTLTNGTTTRTGHVHVQDLPALISGQIAADITGNLAQKSDVDGLNGTLTLGFLDVLSNMVKVTDLEAVASSDDVTNARDDVVAAVGKQQEDTESAKAAAEGAEAATIGLVISCIVFGGIIVLQHARIRSLEKYNYKREDIVQEVAKRLGIPDDYGKRRKEGHDP